ncbi:MAG TPA: response regulator transcription factor [Candidatus Cybelea sp.]|nr:response regulator transcription factor [Candidatus Cybelea sp.]
MTVRVLVVDDHDIVRLGLRGLAEAVGDWEICGEAADGRTAIVKAFDLQPDVIIMDLTMPGMNGFETAMEMRSVTPNSKIILFSVHNLPLPARNVGADAFVSKASGIRELVATVERLLPREREAETAAAVPLS